MLHFQVVILIGWILVGARCGRTALLSKLAGTPAWWRTPHIKHHRHRRIDDLGATPRCRTLVTHPLPLIVKIAHFATRHCYENSQVYTNWHEKYKATTSDNIFHPL